ncbi:hypothetical protein [Burkholderia cenocepacia]|uniref:Nmad2 family putative nucleotide modification protein n=1 Tax=Burkholderia cenocepacia TaxID=95486 RepID=UPI0039EFCF49
MARIHSYVVRYDSGFAPNPFTATARSRPASRRFAAVRLLATGWWVAAATIEPCGAAGIWCTRCGSRTRSRSTSMVQIRGSA